MKFSTKKTSTLLVFLILLTVQNICIAESPAKHQTKNSAEPSFYLGGIQVNEPKHEDWSKALKDNSFNTVAATVYAKQGDWNSANLWYSDKEESVVSEIKAAKQAGLKVVLILRVALDHKFKKNEFLWHGMIMPTGDIELELWFKKYKKFVVKWAKKAQELDVDVFGIGSEMNALTSTVEITQIPSLIDYYLKDEKQENKISILSKAYPEEENNEGDNNEDKSEFIKKIKRESLAYKKWAKEFTNNIGINKPEELVKNLNTRRKKLDILWKDIIKQTRKNYSGKLIYAANFDQFKEVNFWDNLDKIGINAYFTLRNGKEENIEQALTNGWRNVFSDIKKFRDGKNLNNKKIIFTELGYTFKEGSTIAPWASTGYSLDESLEEPKIIFWSKQKENYEERTKAINSLKIVNEEYSKILNGILYWKLSTIKSHIDIEPFVHIIEHEKDREFGNSLIRLSK